MSSPVSVAADANRVSDIAKAIFAAVSPIIADNEAVSEAQKALQDASDARTSGRVGILLSLADIAAKGGWTKGDVDMATAQAIKLANNLESQKAIATFTADCKIAMDPKVRNVVPHLHSLCGEVWEAEKALPKDQPKPCAKAFKRAYHMFKSAMVVARDEGMTLMTPSAVVAWANENDPDFDAKKVRKQLEAMAATIATIAGNFPVSHFSSITEFLSEISEDALKAARRGLLASQEDVLQSHTLAPLPATVVARVAPAATTTVVEEAEVDPVAAYLNELDQGMAA